MILHILLSLLLAAMPTGLLLLATLRQWPADRRERRQSEVD